MLTVCGFLVGVTSRKVKAMASLANLRKLGLKLRKSHISCVTVSTRNLYYNKDWRPAPPPVTPEEREKAAKKYGLRPEDYEPYPDDGTGFGDYPKLPYVSVPSRDPFEDYDMPEIRRNYGDVMHVDADALREDCWDPNMRTYVSYHKMLMVTLLVAGGYVLTQMLLEPYPHYHPVMPKQIPKEGQVHYTFEPAEPAE